MSSDIPFLIIVVTTIIETGINIFAAFRAVQIGRALVAPIYRNRAFLLSALLAYAVIITPLSFTTLQVESTFVGAIVNAIPFGVFLICIFVFVDSTVLAAMETDFFHRDSLGWKRGRRLASVLLLVGVAWGLPASNLGDNSSILVQAGTFLAIAAVFVILGFSIAALIVSSRRVQDTTMRRFVKLLGLAFALFLLAVAADGNSFFIIDLIGDFANVASSYTLYRAVMSLSPLSTTEKEIA